MQLAGKKINFLGDSITEGVGVSHSDKIYLNVLKEKEHLALARNYGVGGTRISSQEDNLRGSYTTRYKTMDDDADIVVVFGGTNDFGHGTAPLGVMEDRTEYTFYGALHILIQGLINKYPTATIIFMTPTPRSYLCDLTNSDHSIVGAALEQYVDIIKEVAAFYSVPVLDLYRTCGFNPNIDAHKKIYCPDGLHPNDRGNEIIASRLAEFLKAL